MTVAVEFHFNIGDVVQHRLDELERANRLYVVERWYQECAGGGQINYVVRGGIWNKELMTFNQIELAPYTAKREPTYNEKASQDQQRHGDKADGRV